jgi:hypothetical protein
VKKSITLIASLILIWFIFIYYAHTTTEEKLHTYTAKINNMYEEMDLGITLAVTGYQSHFFSATAQHSITIHPQTLLKNMNPYFAILTEIGIDKTEIYAMFEQPFTITQQITYGPIFLDNGLEFGRAKSTYKATLTDTITKVIHKINNHIDENSSLKISNENIAKLQSTIDTLLTKEVNIEYSSILALFSNDNTIVAKISEISINTEVKKEAGVKKLLIKPITLRSTYSLDDFTGDLHIHIPLISATDNNIEKLHIKDLTLNYDINEFINSFEYFGNIDMNAEKIKIYLSKQQGSIAFNGGLAITIEKGIAQHFTNVTLNTSVDILQYPNNTPPFDMPKNIEFTIDMLEFNLAELYKTMQAFENYMSSELFDTSGINDNARTPKEFFNQEIKPRIHTIISKDNTQFSVGLHIITQQLSTITNTIRMHTKYVLDNDNLNTLLDLIITQKDKQALLALFKKAIEVEIEIKIAKQLATGFKDILTMPQKMHLIIEDKNMLVSNITYKQGKIFINGKDNEMINQQLEMLEQTLP